MTNCAFGSYRRRQSAFAGLYSLYNPCSAIVEAMMEEQIRKRIKEIIGEMSCSKRFKCAELRFENLCKASDFGDENHLECLQELYPRCEFALYTDSSGKGIRFCRCPLRVYLARELGK